MPISGLSSTVSSPPSPAIQPQRNDFRQLSRALRSGDLSDAQQAYSTLANGKGSQFLNQSPQLAEDFGAIGQKLEAGDLAGAQSAFATFRHDLRAGSPTTENGSETGNPGTTPGPRRPISNPGGGGGAHIPTSTVDGSTPLGRGVTRSPGGGGGSIPKSSVSTTDDQFSVVV